MAAKWFEVPENETVRSSFVDHLARSQFMLKKLQNGLRKRFQMGRLLGRFGPRDGRKYEPSVV